MMRKIVRKSVLFMMVVCLGVVGLVGCNKEVSFEDINMEMKEDVGDDLGLDGSVALAQNINLIIEYHDMIKNNKYNYGGLDNLKSKATNTLGSLGGGTHPALSESMGLGTALVGFTKHKEVLTEDELKEYVKDINSRIKKVASYFKSKKAIQSYLEFEYEDYKDYYYYINQ